MPGGWRNCVCVCVVVVVSCQVRRINGGFELLKKPLYDGKPVKLDMDPE